MEAKSERGMIRLEIQMDESGKEPRPLSFETERTLPLRRVMLDFCDRLDLVYGSVRFALDGKLLHQDKTPDECGLEDGDVIDAFKDQVGGGTSKSSLYHV